MRNSFKILLNFKRATTIIRILFVGVLLNGVTHTAKAVPASTAADVSDTSGTLDYELSAGGAFGTDISFNILQYLGTADSITGNFQANQIQNSGSGKLTFTGNLTIGSTLNLRLLATSGELQFNGVISDNSGDVSALEVQGAFTTYLTAPNNSYTGMTTVDGGVLDVGTISSNSLGSGGLLMKNGGILQGNGLFVRNSAGSDSVGTGLFAAQTGGFAARGGELLLDLTSAANEIIDMNTGGWRFGNNFIFGSATADNKVVLLNHLNINTHGQRVITVNSGVGTASAELRGQVLNSTAAGQISGFIKRGDGLLYLSNANNSYLGITTIDAGMLRIDHIANGGVNSALGKSSNDAQNLVFNGGGLQYAGASAVTDRSFTIQNNRVAVIEVTNASTKLTFTGTINTASTSGGLTKTGNGTLTITGAKNYTGRTTIEGGIFDVGDVATLGSSAIYFTAPANGSALLQGYGTLNRTFDNTNNPGANLAAGEVAGRVGGFAAKGGTLTLNFGPNFALNLAQYVFGDNFILNSAESDHMVEIVSHLNLNSNGSSRKITVNQGVGGDFAKISGNIYEPQGQNSGLDKHGNGLLMLTGANTYDGPTTIFAGTLLANYTGDDSITSPTNPSEALPASSTGNGSVVVNAQGALGGYGKVGTGSILVTINGKLTPGDSTLSDTRDSLTIRGSLTLGSASTTDLEVASLSDFDKVVTTGHTLLDGTINVNFAGFSSAIFSNSFSIDLFDWSTVNTSNFVVGDGMSGDLKFLNVDYGDHLGSWDLSQFTANGANGGVISWVAVPEPSRLCLLLGGLMFCCLRRKTKRPDCNFLIPRR